MGQTNQRIWSDSAEFLLELLLLVGRAQMHLTARKVTLNSTGLYEDQYPFVTMRGPEFNFIQAKSIVSSFSF